MGKKADLKEEVRHLREALHREQEWRINVGQRNTALRKENDQLRVRVGGEDADAWAKRANEWRERFEEERKVQDAERGSLMKQLADARAAYQGVHNNLQDALVTANALRKDLDETRAALLQEQPTVRQIEHAYMVPQGLGHGLVPGARIRWKQPTIGTVIDVVDEGGHYFRVKYDGDDAGEWSYDLAEFGESFELLSPFHQPDFRLVG